MTLPTRSHFLAHNITPTTPSPSSSSTSTSCAICKEDYNTTTGHPAVTFSNTTSCNHIFCEPCIVAWLSAKGTNTCPLCRCELFVLDDGEGEVEYENEGGVEVEGFGEEEEDEDGDVEYFFAGGGVWDGEEGEDDEEEDEEDDDEFPFEEEDEFEGGDGLEDIPLSYLYRNTLLPLQTTPAETHQLHQTIWHKIWNLSSTYRTAVTQAIDQAKRDDKPLPHWDHASFSRHLPTTTTMVASLVEAVLAHTGTDLSGRLTAEMLGRLEGVLKIALEEMLERVNEAGGWEDEMLVPDFKGGWKAEWCRERLCLLLGLALPRETAE